MSAELRRLALDLFNKGDVVSATLVKNLSDHPDMAPSVAAATPRENLPEHQLPSNIARTYPPHIVYRWDSLSEDTMIHAQYIEGNLRTPYIIQADALFTDCPELEKPLFVLVFQLAEVRIKKRKDYIPIKDGSIPSKTIIFNGLSLPDSPVSFLGLAFSKHVYASPGLFVQTTNMVIEEANAMLEPMGRNPIPYLQRGK